MDKQKRGKNIQSTKKDEKLLQKQTTGRSSEKIGRQRETTFEAAKAAGGTSSSVDTFYLVVGPVPCYPVCCPLHPLVHRGFPSTPPVAPSSRIPLARFPSTSVVVHPPPIPFGTTHGASTALPTQLGLVLVPPRHKPLGCLQDPSVPPPGHGPFCCS